MKIIDIKAREILDSRGFPTIEVDVICQNAFGRASIPSGASTGSKEAIELRDNNEDRYMKKGVLKAVSNVLNIIKPSLLGMDVTKQKLIDDTMITLDATENKSNLGANAILGVSIACLKAAANFKKKHLFEYLGKGELPIPMMNIINGGAHADNNINFQEFMIVPNAKTFKERLRIGAEVFHTLKRVLKENGYNTNVGDEGGFAPDLKSNIQALDFMTESVNKAGYTPGKDVFFALDVAASEFYSSEEGKYLVDGEYIDNKELLNLFIKLVNKYPIISIEDPFDENDFEGFTMITDKIGNNVQIVGDDLFVTNKKILQKGIDSKACNAILLKLNQIGTVTEMLETIELAKKHNYKTIISHRSGETEDTYIADFAVGLNLKQIKTGSLSRSERVAKYNQLLRIEELISK